MFSRCAAKRYNSAMRNLCFSSFQIKILAPCTLKCKQAWCLGLQKGARCGCARKELLANDLPKSADPFLRGHQAWETSFPPFHIPLGPMSTN